MCGEKRKKQRQAGRNTVSELPGGVVINPRVLKQDGNVELEETKLSMMANFISQGSTLYRSNCEMPDYAGARLASNLSVEGVSKWPRQPLLPEGHVKPENVTISGHQEASSGLTFEKVEGRNNRFPPKHIHISFLISPGGKGEGVDIPAPSS